MNTPPAEVGTFIEPRSDRVFLGVACAVFLVSAGVSMASSVSMSAMPEMPMAGGWSMSMTWMRMPGRTWPGSAAEFLGMWIVMMVAMMLPALVPMLRRFRGTLHPRTPRRGVLTWWAGAGYFSCWAFAGAIVFPFGVAFAALAMQSVAVAQAVPFVASAVVIASGALQLTEWKSRTLACCRGVHGQDAHRSAYAAAAFRHGVDLGIRCVRCCLAPTAVLFTLGVMDLKAMVLVTVAISIERLAPGGHRYARGIGAIMVAGGASMLVRAAMG